jgi:ribosomal protein S20
MPIGRSAKKSLRKARRNQKTNVTFKNKLKAAIKSFLAKPTEKGLVEAQSILDKSVNMNIWHKNKVARVKAGLSKKISTTAKTEVVKTAPKKTAKKTVKAKMSK